MTFKDIAFKNFKVNMKKYLSYFLCSSFSVAICFIYATLLFNDQLTARDDANMIKIIFVIALVAITVFSVFFINYAHSAFVKSRNKEFGIYLSLGMTTKDIGRIILLENSLIISGSLIAGLLSGLIFSRLFQMIVIKLLDYDHIGYVLSYKSFLLTIALFACIFGGVIGFSKLSTRKLQINDLLKQSRKHEGNMKSSLLPGLAGIVLILLSVVVLMLVTRDNDLKSNPMVILGYILLVFAGVYMTLSYFGKTLLGLIRKNRSTYYANVLPVTEIHHKFNQNKKVLFVLSILSAMIIFFVASPFSLYNLSNSIAVDTQRNHMEYAEIAGVNAISPDAVKKAIQSAHVEIQELKSVEFIRLYWNGKSSKPIVSQTAYHAVTGRQLSIPKGQAVNVITNYLPGNFGTDPQSTIQLESDTGKFSYYIKECSREKWVTGAEIFPSDSGLVLNDADYAALKSNLSSQFIGTFHGIQLKDWMNSMAGAKSLRSTLEAANAQVTGLDQDFAKNLKLASRIETYTGLKQGYSLFIFIMTIMGLLFFIASETVLFFKQYAEIGSAREKFYKLYKLGICKKEAMDIISKELRLTFFTPLVLGGIMGYSFMYFMTFLVGGDYVIKEFMVNATIVVLAYFLFQAVFYVFTRNKYARDVLGQL